MIFVNHFNGAQAAKDYMAEHLSKGDYFAKDAELLRPRFEGLAADILGLGNRVVDQKAFFDLVDNVNPVTGEQITARTKTARRAMTDVTFDLPKSVSLAGITDDRIAVAVDQAITETMREIEAAMAVRVRKGGQDHDRVSGNAIWVKWAHETTRPLSDGTVDPQMHRHVTVLNMSYDPVEKTMKATQFGNIVRDKGYYQAAFHARIGDKLTGLGYGIEREGKSFRLMGIEKSTCDKFSRRNDVINKAAEEKGMDTPEGRAKLARSTRNRKGNELANEDLRKEWFSRMTPKELESIHNAGTGVHKTRPITAEEAMAHAVEHSFERKSVISEKNLQAAALIHGVGSVTVESVHVLKPDVIRKVKGDVAYVTTKEVYREELDMVAFARDGKGRFPRLSNSLEIQGSWVLSKEQESAKRTILGSRDRVTLLEGRAGTGKTRMMLSTVQAIEAAGTKVNAFAPSADASRGVLRSEGFPNADTVERLLTDRSLQREIAGRVLLVDEAGLLSVKDTHRLFQLAEKNNNRLILSGDTKQHTSVGRGDALRILEKEAGLKPATLREIRRQKNAVYRDAVNAISKGQLEAGIKKLDSIGAVVNAGDDRYKQVAADYLEALAERKTALVVTPTHAEAAKVTAEVREGMKAKKRLTGKERTLPTLYGVNFTVAERKDALNYEEGMVVGFHKAIKGFRRGDKATVTGRMEAGATVDYHGKECVLPLDQAERFQIYRKTTLPVSAGESIRITKNGRVKANGKEIRLDNGTVYNLAGFTEKGDLRFSNGFVVPKDYGHLAYGYTSTSHASQGKTVDRVLISMSADSLSAANKEQFYVSVSRGKEAVKLYTDDRQALLEAVQKSGARMSATELLGEPKQTKLIELNRIRRAYNAIKERTQQAITQLKERTRELKRA